MADESRREQEFDLRTYLQVLKNRKWLILGFTAALTVAVGVGTALQPKVYEAKVTLLVGREAPRLLTSDPIPGDRIGQRDYLKTQAAILSSRTLLQGAVKRLMPEGLYGIVAKDRVEETSSKLAKELQPRTRVQTAEDTQLITVIVAGGVPDRVARIANAIADEYVASNQESKSMLASQAVAWLTTKLAEQRGKLTEAEEELRAYKEKENIVAPDEADPFSTLSLSRINDEYLTTRFQRMERQTRLAAMKRNRGSRPAQGRSSTAESLDAETQRKVRESLEADYIQTRLDLRKLSERYGPEHPDIITLTGKVARIQKELESLEQPIVRTETAPPVTDAQIADLQAELTTLTQKESVLAQTLKAQKAQSRNLSRTGVAYSLRKQAVDMNRQSYNDLLSRLNDAQLSGQIKISAVRVLDRAEPPGSPTEPQPVRNLMVAVLLGLVLGVGLATLADNLDRRIRNPEEAARYLRLPLLTVIPALDIKTEVGKGEGKAELVAFHRPRSHAAECYRNLRTSILFSTGRPVPKTILVTSAVGGEGKSTTAANLAFVMTQSGRRVLLVDADLRRPALHRYFARERNRGIVRLLKESCRLEEAVQASYVEHLDLLLCPSVPSNPSEMLGSDRMVGLIEQFKSRYDVVVIDAPVVISVPDAIIMASRAEAVLMVHRPGAASREMVRHAREKLDEVKANILGLVMNNVDLKKDGYHYPNYLYYGYGATEGESVRQDSGGKKA
ncbi:MAG TPA: polysaccharide biosynthesis tyrosine autokinase [Candidatus Polarisedimenticolia bacterium]|jgi:capsular exopolysaccharide synthesis family protein|nr:polysaccharide biosynthesis tyrosine autokinase [Candidatus Polarisedimenticolia bacterium]